MLTLCLLSLLSKPLTFLSAVTSSHPIVVVTYINPFVPDFVLGAMTGLEIGTDAANGLEHGLFIRAEKNLQRQAVTE